MMLSGTFTALITPFNADQELDEEGLIANIHYQIAQGISGILLLGTTGESPTLSPQEQKRIIQIGVREIKGKVPLLVGTGTNCTRSTIEKTLQAAELGADAVSVIIPYYNKPTQEGIYRHFEAITKQVNIPVLIYNNPGRSAVQLENETLVRIAELPSIIGIKDEMRNQPTIRNKPFTVLSGDDVLTLPMMVLGAKGVVSVASNLIPRTMVDLVQAALKGDFDQARQLHEDLCPLFKALYLETNPIPIKAAMRLNGMAAGECRLPLCAMAPRHLSRLQQVLETIPSLLMV